MILPCHSSSIVPFIIVNPQCIRYNLCTYKLTEPGKQVLPFRTSVFLSFSNARSMYFSSTPGNSYFKILLSIFFLLSCRNGDHTAERPRQYSHRSFCFFCCKPYFFEFCFPHSVTSFVLVTPTYHRLRRKSRKNTTIIKQVTIILSFRVSSHPTMCHRFFFAKYHN